MEHILNDVMDKKDLLKEIMHFNDEVCNCKVVCIDKKVVSKYKAESNESTEHINAEIFELGLRYIKVRKYTDKNNGKTAYLIGLEHYPLLDIFKDIDYRFYMYKTIRSKMCKHLPEFSESEIRAFISMTVDLIYELSVSEVNLESFFDITDEQRNLFSCESIYTYNSLFIPYVLKELEAHEKGKKIYEEKFFSQLYDYIFCETEPLEYIGFGEYTRNEKTVYGLKLRNKNYTLADFLEMFCCDEVVDILYKKSYGRDKSYLAESLRCAYYIALGLETI